MVRDINYLRRTEADKKRIELFKKLDIFKVFSSRELKVILSYLRPYFRGIIFLIILTLGLSFLEGLKALSVVAFIKSLFLESMDFLSNFAIFGKYKVAEFIIFKNKVNLIAFIFIAFVLLSIISVVVKFFISMFTRRFQLKLMKDLRKDLYNKIVSFSLDFFNEAKSGELLFMVNAEVSRFSNIILHFKNLLSSFFTMFLFMGILFYMSPFITSVIILLGILFLYFHQRIQKRLMSAAWQANFHMNTLQQIFYEIIYGIKLIKLGGLEKRERDEYINYHSKFEEEDLRTVKLKSVSEAAKEGFFIFILTLFSFSLFYLMGKGIFVNDNTFILSYMVVLLRVVPYFSQFQGSILSTIEAYAPLTRIVDILTTPVEEKRPLRKRGYADSGPIEKLRVDNISFSYKDKDNVLKDIGLEFCKGKMYAIVSFSGGGKSTLLDLMANIRIPDKGEILFNNLKIEDINLKALKNKIGYMNQEPLIFHDTIKENVLFFKERITPAEMDEALDMAAVKEFVYSLPQGINTGLGERGLTISGGERQRIGLARVFLKDAEILLLDEATNSLDYKTERIIYDNLRKIKKEKIIIVAAHRLSSLVDFDQIIVLYNGRVEEKGVHKELLELKGVYYSLYRLQEDRKELINV